jgi:hypothetical protein
LFRLPIDSIHQSLRSSPITVAGGAEKGLGKLAAVLLDEVSRPIKGCALAAFSPDTVRWRRAAVVELRKLGIEL